MSQFILLNTVIIGTSKHLPGELVDESVPLYASMLASGGSFWNAGDEVVAQAAAIANTAHMSRGMNESDMTAILMAACDMSSQQRNNGTHRALRQATWFIDPVKGSDARDGTTAKRALKTWAEFVNRIGLKSVISPTGGTLTINVLGNLPIADPIVWDFRMSSGTHAIVLGTKTQIGAGGISAATTQDPSSNQPWTITDAAKPVGYWSAPAPDRPFGMLGQLVEIVTGTGTGSRAWVCYDAQFRAVLGPKEAHMSNWMSGENPDFGGNGSGLFPSDPPDEFSTYKVWNLSTALLGFVNVDGDEISSAVPATPFAIASVIFINFKFVSNLPDAIFSSAGSSQWAMAAFSECIFDVGMDVFPAFFMDFANCNFRGLIDIHSGVPRIFGGAFTPFLNPYISVYPGAIRTEDHAAVILGGTPTFAGDLSMNFTPADIRSVQTDAGSISLWNGFHGVGMASGSYRVDGDPLYGDQGLVPFWGDNMAARMSFDHGILSIATFQVQPITGPFVIPTLPSPEPSVIQVPGVDANVNFYPWDFAAAAYKPSALMGWSSLHSATFDAGAQLDFGPWGAFKFFAFAAHRPEVQVLVRSSQFMFEPPPGIDTVAPPTGTNLGGTAVTINGSNFLSGATVEFDGVTAGAIVVVNDGQITCTSPVHAAGAVAVVVTNTSGAFSNDGAFTYT